MRNLYEQCLKLTQFAALEFEEIFQFSQERLKQALETELIENGYAVRKQRGFLYAEGTVPVLLVAHLDTVHRTQPETICYSADGTVMMSPQGIGGDDRAGVYMILRLIQRVHCHVLFCEDEETGGHGHVPLQSPESNRTSIISWSWIARAATTRYSINAATGSSSDISTALDSRQRSEASATFPFWHRI